MANYNATGTRGELAAVTISTGAVLPVSVLGDPSTFGVTLPGAGTFYFPFGGEQGPVPVEVTLLSLSLRWALAVAGTATIEVCNFAKTVGGYNQGAVDVSDFDSNVQNWQIYNPAQTGSTYAAVSGASNTVAAMTVTAGGLAAGGAHWNLYGMASQRMRLKIVATVGGLVRASCHGKLGA